MGKADRFTDTEIEYIRAVYPELGPTEIARRLGRSLSAVKARIKQLGLVKEKRREIQRTTEPQDTRERLIELRDMLRTQLVDAPPNSIASICKEYRAVLKEIETIDAACESEDKNPLAIIAESIANGMRT